MTNTSERAQLEWSGIPARGGAIQFTRRGAGCQIATVYGVGPRAFRIKVVRLMDGPGWQLEPCYVYFGVDQPLDAVTRANLFLDGFEGARDPRSSLKEARSLVWDIWSEWRSRLGTDDERVQTFGGPGAGVAR